MILKDPIPPLFIPDLEAFPKWLSVCIDSLNDAIVITEAEPVNAPGPRIVWANKVFFVRNGYAPEELIGQNPRILQGPLSDRKALDKVRRSLEKWQPVRAETLNYRKDGTTYWNEFEIVPVADESGWFTHWISVQRDVSERKEMEARLAELASTDSLTGMLNRRSFLEKLADELDRLDRRYSNCMAVMMIDLDHFKKINDTWGHLAGDCVLRDFARLAKNSLRRSDSVGRLGGEEFAMLLPGTTIAAAKAFAERLLKLARESVVRFGEEEISYSISIGISGNEKFGKMSADEILALADKALYQAKRQGRDRAAVLAG